MLDVSVCDPLDDCVKVRDCVCVKLGDDVTLGVAVLLPVCVCDVVPVPLFVIEVLGVPLGDGV